ncbi:MAG: CDP-glycerol glycerophosphotransferase family protein [Woeseiaceae bacterium]
MSLIKEFVSLWRIRFRTPKEERKVIFYSEHESYISYFDGLIDALKSKHLDPFCYVTSDIKDPILTADIPGVHVFYVNRMLPMFMKFVNCRVFVMTLTDLDKFHLQRSVNPVHYVYVFHAMNSTHMAYRHGAFDHYDSILCTGPYQVRELQRDGELRSIGKRDLIEAGYSRLERIHDAWSGQRSETHASSARTVLVAPSWAASNVLEEHGVELVTALRNAEFKVIVRPHPETNKRYPELSRNLQQAFSADDGFQLEQSVRTDDSMLAADVLITDWSGIALEYAFGTERPVLYMDVPRKVHNDRYEELGIEPFEASMRTELGIVMAPDQIDHIADFVNQLVNNRQRFRDQIVRLRSENVFNFGHSSEIGAQHICELLSFDAQSQSN